MEMNVVFFALQVGKFTFVGAAITR